MRRRTTGLLGVWICALLVCPLGRAQAPAVPQAPRTGAEVLTALRKSRLCLCSFLLTRANLQRFLARASQQQPPKRRRFTSCCPRALCFG
jgi:hypothetical protein